MPRFNDIQNNFINGEISTKAYGRSESEIYKRSAREIKNMIVHPQGGASRRVGSQLLAQYLNDGSAAQVLANISEDALIVPFPISEDESYLIIFNKKQSVSLGNYVSYYCVKSGCIKTNFLDPDAIIGTYTRRTITSVSSAEFATGLLDGDVLDEMQWAQVGNVLVFVHEDFPPFCIARTAENVLAFVSYASQFRGAASTAYGPYPMMDMNISDITMDASATAIGACTITASQAYWNDGHEGSYFAFQDSGTVGVAVLTNRVSSTVMDATIFATLPAAATSSPKTWYECAWSDYRGWPRTVAFWQGSLVFAGSPSFPDRVWKSQVFDIYEMTNENVLDPAETAVASDPGFFDIGSNKVNKITWLSPSGTDLLAGSVGPTYAIDALSSSEISSKPQTSYGSVSLMPTVVDDVIVYIQRGFRKLREILFEERTAGYTAADITFLGEHIARISEQEVPDAVPSKFKKIVYQALDDNLLWVIDNNGYLCACTRSRENAVVAWHRHELGGSYNSGPPKILDAAVLPSADGTHDELYLLVKRTINSLDSVTLEKVGANFYEEELDSDVDERKRIPIFMDCSKVFRTTPTAEAPEFFARLKSSVTADSAVGSTTGTFTGTASFFKNMLQLDGTPEYLSYSAAGGNANFAQVGCIKISVSNPSGPIVSISKSTTDNKNLLELSFDADGYTLTVRDQAGTAFINGVILGGYDFGAINGGIDHLELNYDFTVGATRLFRNGVQVGATITSTGTRDAANINFLRVGNNFDVSLIARAQVMYVSDLQVYNTVQHTEDFEFFEYTPESTTIERLDYLEGQVVQVLGDGLYLGTFTVSGGAIALGGVTTYSTLVIGLAYENLIETQPVDAGSGIGSSQGAIKRIHKAMLRFRASAAAQVGYGSTFEELKFTSDPSSPIPLLTDDIKMDFPGDYDIGARIIIKNSKPLPCNVTCLTLTGQTYD